ncbi:NAD(P)-binding domain-containing protein [Pseudomonas sp. Z2-11]
MSYAIIGFGKIGQALAKAFARSGIDVSVATTRDASAVADQRLPSLFGTPIQRLVNQGLPLGASGEP